MEEGEYKNKVQIKLKGTHKHHHSHHHKNNEQNSQSYSNEKNLHEKKNINKKKNREEKENENNKNEKIKSPNRNSEKKNEKINEIKEQNKPLENITFNENINIQLNTNQNTNNIKISNSHNEKVYCHITKNDKMKILFKLEIDKENLLKNNTYEIKKTFKSIREDIWNIKLIHEYNNESKLGKIKIVIYLEKPSEEKKEKQTQLSSIFESIYFNLELSLNFLSYKIHNTELQNIIYYKNFQTSEISIPQEIYLNDLKNINNFNIIFEMLITKNFFNFKKFN